MSTEHEHNGAPLTPEQSVHVMRAAAASVLVDRLNFMRAAGMSFNGKRDLYAVLGYPRDLGSKDYQERYFRGGIAGRVVDALPKATWRGEMELVEDENPDTQTTFEKAWFDLERRLSIRATLQKADILSQLSTYAVILIGSSAAGGDLSSELPKGKPDQLLYLTPFIGGGGPSARAGQRYLDTGADATIHELETDITNPRFGQPKTYQIRRLDIATPEMQVPIHWSRVIHIAEGCLLDDLYGTPSLERVWNLLDDLDKVTGGGAEAFWLRANQGMHLDVSKDMTLPEPEKLALAAQAEEYEHQQRRWLRTRGVTVTSLGSDVANFSNPADAVLTQIAGAKSIPKRILTGSEMGELASSQDRDNWKDQINGRQTGYVGPNIVRRLLKRLIDYGYMPAPAKGPDAYEVRWPQIQVMTEAEKSAGAQQWAATNQTQGAPVFTEEEIRDKWYGMAPLTPEQIKAATPELAEEAPQEERFPRAASARKLSSTHIQLPKGVASKLLAFGKTIPDEDLAADGRENDPHVTVKYGLHTTDVGEVTAAVSGFVGPVEITLGKTAVFKGEGHDVLYVVVNSRDLRKLNAKIAGNLEVTDTHDGYVPHATIAYLKPGLGKKYADNAELDGLTVEVSTMVFSPSEGDDKVVDFDLKTAEAASRETEPDDELVRVLASAIVANQTDVIDRIIGVRREEPTVQPLVVEAPKPRLVTSSRRVEYDAEGRITRIIREPEAAAS